MVQMMNEDIWKQFTPAFPSASHQEFLCFSQATIGISGNTKFLQRLEEIQGHLSEMFFVGYFSDAAEATTYCRNHPVDVVILDTDQKGIGALEIAKNIREMDKDIHLIFFANQKKDAMEALSLHVIDYHLKPLTIEKLERSLKWVQKSDWNLYQYLSHRSPLYAGAPSVDRRGQQMRQIRAHRERVAKKALLLVQTAKELGCLKQDEKTYGQWINDLYEIVSLHDVGKEQMMTHLKDFSKIKNIYQLTREQRFILMQHVKKGFLSLIQAGDQLIKQRREMYHQAAYVALLHHERWDGRGYPIGLSQFDIPFAARICAICNGYDHLVTQYGLSASAAAKQIEQDVGKIYDPTLGEIFVSHIVSAIKHC